MDTLRKLIGLLFLMALALPASAQKIYTLGVTALDSTTVQIKVTNVSPPTQSNSTLNSFRIRSVFTLTQGQSASPSQPATVILNSPPTSLNVKDFNGIKAAPLTPNSIAINVKLATPYCGTSTWYIDGYTGNSLNGPINFSQVNASGAPQNGTTLTGPPCGLTIAVPPTTYVDTAFQVSVGYTGPGPAPASITLSWSCPTAASQTNTSPTNPTLFSVTLANTGICTFTASAPNYASATASTTVYTGSLDCGGTDSSGPGVDVTQDWSYPQGNVLTAGAWSLIRGLNKDGASCSVVPYTFTLDTSGKQSASFVVPSTQTQKVAAQYVVVWAPVATSGGWYEARPHVAWISDGSGPVYMPALPCTQDPTNFAGLSPTDLANLMPAIPNAFPYNVGLLASTYGYSTTGNIVKAKMCVSQHGWTAIGPVQSEDENGTKTLVQPWDKIIDLGDGFVSRDF